MSSNDKKQILKNLIKFNKSLKNIKNEISNLNFDSKFELYIITKNDIKQILNRALKENITFKELEEWANLIECRDDLGLTISSSILENFSAAPKKKGPFIL